MEYSQRDRKRTKPAQGYKKEKSFNRKTIFNIENRAEWLEQMRMRIRNGSSHFSNMVWIPIFK